MNAPDVEKDHTTSTHYWIDGKPYARVTHVLGCLAKPALIHWSANVERDYALQAAAGLHEDLDGSKLARAAFVETCRQRMGSLKAFQREQEKAKDIGSEAHALCEWYVKQQMGSRVKRPASRPESDLAFGEFVAWWTQAGLAPVASECRIHNPAAGYAGTVDLLATKDGDGVLVDFKTSKSIVPRWEYRLQLAAYAEALRLRTPHFPVAACYIVRLPKVPGDGFEVVDVCDLPNGTRTTLRNLYGQFLDVMRAWQVWTDLEAASKPQREAVEK